MTGADILLDEPKLSNTKVVVTLGVPGTVAVSFPFLKRARRGAKAKYCWHDL